MPRCGTARSGGARPAGGAGRFIVGASMKVLAAMSGVGGLLGGGRPHGRRRPRRWSACTSRCPMPRDTCVPGRGAAAQRTPQMPAASPTSSKIPFYVWDFADQFQGRCHRRLRVVLRARGDPEPACAAASGSSSRAGRPAAGAGIRRSGHRPLRAGSEGPAAPCRRPRQGPVLRPWVLTAEQLRHAVFPIGDTPSRPSAEAARRDLAVASKPDNHDICFIPSGTPGRSWVRDRPAPGAVVDAGGTVLARTTACTVHHRPAQGPRYRGAGSRTAAPATSPPSTPGPARCGSAASGPRCQLDSDRPGPGVHLGSCAGGPIECEVRSVRMEDRRRGGEVIDGPTRRRCAALRGWRPARRWVVYRRDPDGDGVWLARRSH